ncbi:MAG: ABC transporter permease [Peptococcia bacterium]
MNIWEGIKMAVSALKDNKIRSLLTALGIIIGVGAVIALISIGQGATKSVTDSISSMGSNLIIVMPSRGTPLTTENASEMLERVPTVVKALPTISTNVTSKYANKTYNTTMEGTIPEYLQVKAASIASGRFISQDDLDRRSNIAVIGNTVAQQLFAEQSPLGEKLILKGQSFTIVGILDEKGSTFGMDNDDLILIPLTTFQRLVGTKQIASIYFQARSAEEASLAVSHISAVFDQINRRDDSVRVTSQDELLDIINQTTQTLGIMLGAIAGISLLVGGIGIMNIMLVSVTERTREIGIRKALGAKRRNIMFQFILESIFLSVGGGLIGILIGGLLAVAVSTLAGWPSVISPGAIMLSFFFSAGIGLFFGVYPAYKAANLDPIEALRHE